MDLVSFQEAKLPVTRDDLLKPTKEFVVNLITIFFNQFKINGSAIKQPTLEQYDVLLLKERELYDESIKIINLYAAMSKIYEKIFMKDFQLLDILNPTSKRTQKWTKFLANFVLYFNTKLADIENRFKELEERRNMVNQYNVKREEALEKIAVIKKYRETQIDYNEELKQEIEELQMQILKKKNIMENNKKEIERIDIEKAKSIEIYAASTAEAAKVNKITEELQAQVVGSPDKLKAQLRDLEKEKELKIEEREVTYESLKQKNQLLAQREQVQSFIQKETEKLVQVVELFNNKKTINDQLEEIMKKREMLQENNSKLKNDQKIEENHCSPEEIKELNNEIEHRLQPLRDQCKQLAKEAKEMELKLLEDQEQRIETTSLIDLISQEIVSKENDISAFLLEFEELYKKEMSNEESIQEKMKQFCYKKHPET